MPNIGLIPEDNAEYTRIVDGYNELMDEWNLINEELLTKTWVHKVLNLFKETKQLNKTGKALNELQKEWITQNKIAWHFVANPKFKFHADVDDKTSFYVYHSILLSRISQFRSSMDRIVTNYNSRHRELESKLNFRIAATSIVMSLIGLCLALLK